MLRRNRSQGTLNILLLRILKLGTIGLLLRAPGLLLGHRALARNPKSALLVLFEQAQANQDNN